MEMEEEDSGARKSHLPSVLVPYLLRPPDRDNNNARHGFTREPLLWQTRSEPSSIPHGVLDRFPPGLEDHDPITYFPPLPVPSEAPSRSLPSLRAIFGDTEWQVGEAGPSSLLYPPRGRRRRGTTTPETYFKGSAKEESDSPPVEGKKSKGKRGHGSEEGGGRESEEGDERKAGKVARKVQVACNFCRGARI